ncbi:MAG: amidohydrolase family protein [Coriobacteriia bacterium]
MIIAADWIVPVSGPPIHFGAVRVHGATIAEIGNADSMRRTYPAAPYHEYRGCVVAPGLVNAHTHLSLSSLAGLLPPAQFEEWLSDISPAVLGLDHDDYASASAFGALECLRSGVTAVGDIVYGPEAPSSAADIGVGGVFFWEVLGIAAEDLMSSLESREYPTDEELCHGRTLCGLGPHAPYSAGPGLLQAVHTFASKRKTRVAMHVAESPAELRLLSSGAGPLASVAKRLAPGFKAPGMGSVRYLEHIGVLSDIAAVHCVQLTPGEAELLAARTAGVILCPRSNRHLHNGQPPVKALREAGARLALGTDSLASNSDLDLFAEARALWALDPAMTAARLLEIMTLEGATVLGVQEQYGALSPGRHADIIVVSVGETGDPVTALVEQGAPARIKTVISAGVWRIIDGQARFPTAVIEKQNARVAMKAARAIEHSKTPEGA